MWCHVNLWFESEEQYGKRNLLVRNYLHELISVANVTEKDWFFYLYEPDPHCFLAIDLEENRVLDFIKRIRKRLMPNWIKRISFTFPTVDSTNDPDFLAAICAVSHGILKGKLANQKPDRKKGVTEFHHLIHCLMDMYYGSRDEERACYKQMLKWYKPLSISRRRRRKH